MSFKFLANISVFLKNRSSASLRIKMSSSCLIKCHRIVDELSQKTCRRRRLSGIFRYVLPPNLFVVDKYNDLCHINIIINETKTVLFSSVYNLLI